MSDLRELQGLPMQRVQCQEVLRRHGYKGFKIDHVEPARPLLGPDGAVVGSTARAYVLSSPRLRDGAMRRSAHTAVFWFEGPSVEHELWDGWVVD